MRKCLRTVSSSDGSRNKAGSVSLCCPPPSWGERLKFPGYLQSHQLCVMSVWHPETPGKDASHAIMAKTIWLKCCSFHGTHHHNVRYPNPKKSEYEPKHNFFNHQVLAEFSLLILCSKRVLWKISSSKMSKTSIPPPLFLTPSPC